MNEEKRDFFIDLIRPNSGCDLAKSCGFVAFKNIFEKSNGDPCNECSFALNDCKFLKRKAKILIKETPERLLRKRFGHKTNAEIAKEKGISKRQVSKMKRKGLL